MSRLKDESAERPFSPTDTAGQGPAAAAQPAEPAIDLGTFALAVRRRAVGVSVMIIAGILAGALWAWRSGSVYEVLIVAAPTENEMLAGGALMEAAGFASLIGLAPATQVTRTDEAIATLESRAFLYSFVSDLDLLPVLFGMRGERWWVPPFWPTREPTLADAYELIQSDVLAVTEKRSTGMIEISVRWTDPDTTAKWGAELIARLNREMQSRSRARAQREMEFLKEELKKTDSIQIQEAIFKLVETQMKTLMLANVSDDFALRVVDPPIAPDPDKPVNLSLPAKMAVGGLAGFIIALSLVFVRDLRFVLRR